MRFSRRTRSRLTLALIGVVGLPYMSICCVVAPLGGGMGNAACCPMAGSSRPMHHPRAGDPGDSHVAMQPGSHGIQPAHTEASPTSGREMPAPSCCQLTGKFQVAIQSSMDPGARSGVVVLISTRSEPATDSGVVQLVDEPAPYRVQAPPLYLTNSSFLI